MQCQRCTSNLNDLFWIYLTKDDINYGAMQEYRIEVNRIIHVSASGISHVTCGDAVSFAASRKADAGQDIIVNAPTCGSLLSSSSLVAVAMAHSFTQD